MSMNRGQAWDLLTKYNKEPFHLRHAITVEHVMGWYARELGYGDRAEFWSTVGLLHDLDFEMWPEEHCEKSQELMRDAGVEEYIWSTSGDSRVRESHKKLNGKRFRWDDPPVVDEKTGRRCHPGEDYECRCVALAVFDFDTIDLPIAA